MERHFFIASIGIDGFGTVMRTHYKLRNKNEREVIVSTMIPKKEDVTSVLDVIKIITKDLTDDPVANVFHDNMELGRISFKEFETNFSVFLYFYKQESDTLNQERIEKNNTCSVDMLGV